MHNAPSRQPGSQASNDSGCEPAIPVRELLGEQGKIRLEHGGEIYLLRITRNGKLILTK